jgi:hypothetical protein
MKREINILLVNELRTSLEEFLYLIRHYDPKYEVVVEVCTLFLTLLYLFITFTVSSFPFQEIVLTEPELELVRTESTMKFSPPIRMCFIRLTRIGFSSSFDDTSRDSNDHGRPYRQSSDSNA